MKSKACIYPKSHTATVRSHHHSLAVSLPDRGSKPLLTSRHPQQAARSPSLIHSPVAETMEPKENSEILVGSSGGSDTTSSDCVSQVRKLLFRRMLVGIKDGRFFLGSFHCLDKQGNIILQDAVEYRSTRRLSPSPMEQRCLGLILIPSSCRTSCHIDCSIEEQLSLLKFDR